MAYFNLPFGVRISNNNPLDGDRYIVSNIAARDALVTADRAYAGLQVFVESDKTLYILKNLSPSSWEIIGSDPSTLGDAYLKKTTDRFTGVLTLDGSIVLNGAFIQNGSTYETHAEQIYSKDDYIIMREGALGALPDGSLAGFKIIKPNGVNNLFIGCSDDGILRVGWENDTFVAVAGRQDSPTNYGVARWNSTLNIFETGNNLTYNGTTLQVSGAVNANSMYASGAITSNSDIRTKNIYGPVVNVLPVFPDIEVFEYNFLGSNQTRFGFSAQNLNQFFPYVSIHNENRDSYELDHLGLIALAFQAIKELKAENELLKSKLGI